LALYAWPVLLLLPALFAIVRMGARLAGKLGGLFALLLGASCGAAMEPFRPGSVDHHNVQLVLTLWMIAFLLEFDRSRWMAAGAALMACLSMAVGLETLPYIIVALLAVVLWWIADGKAIAPHVRTFGAVFAGASILLLGGAAASAYRFVAACDTFSGFYAALCLAGGIGLVAVCSMPFLERSALHRGAAFIVLGGALIALAAAVGPECLRGPYAAVDPRLGPIWFSRIEEAQSPFVLAAQAPGNFVAGYGYAVLAVLAAIAAIALVPHSDRRAAGIVAAFALAALIVTSLEVRGTAFAQMYALPGLAALVVTGISRLRLPGPRSVLATIVALFAASNASFAVAANAIQTSLPKDQRFYAIQDAWHEACLAPGDFAALAALPTGRVLAVVDQGPFILAYTHHSAIGGPYHRDAAGILDSFIAFTGTPAKSAAIVARRGIDYVAICKPAPDYAFYRQQDGDKGILSQLAAGKKIVWLAPIPSKGAGKIELYRVRKDVLARAF
jgi:hypothetical protein